MHPPICAEPERRVAGLPAEPDAGRAPMPDRAGPVLQLFGAAMLIGDGTTLAFARQRRFQLLCYLALAARSVDRDRLAFLFWPDEANDEARRHLRKMLYDLKSLPALVDTPLRADAVGVEWRIDTDVRRFEAALQAGRRSEAIAIGAPALADGLEGSSPEFDDWLVRERERLRCLWRRALVEWLADNASAHEAGPRASVDRALLQDPIDEELAIARIGWLLRQGVPVAARRAYGTLVSALESALGVAPTLAWEAIVAGAGPNSARLPAPTPGPRAMSAPVTRFFGRQRELADLTREFSEGRRRLVTIVGPPGVGKTRLALQFAAAWSGPLAPVVVGLESLDPHSIDCPALASDHALLTRIGAALGVDLHAASDPAAGLISTLNGAETLLVLDNFEHRLGDAWRLDRLLAETRVSILVTSRVRLGLAAEAFLPLSGLDAKAPDGGDAMRLFIDRAGLRLPLEAQARELAERICVLAGGQPLALELAARQSRHMALHEVAQRLASDLDAVCSDAADLPPRQRSLAAAFEGSWRLLGPDRQRALARLSVLRGSFDRGFAEAVLGAAMPAERRAVEATLAELGAASLLSHDPVAGRHAWHPFVREFAAARLAHWPDQAQAALRGLCLHAVETLERWQLVEDRPDPAALAWVGVEFDHLVSAWRHALSEPRIDWWEALGEAIALHCEMHARYDEGARLLAEAARYAAEAPGGDRSTARACKAARITVLRARLQHWLEGRAARQTIEAAMLVFAENDDVAGRIACLRVLGLIAWRSGDGDRAAREFMAALTMGEASGYTTKRAILLDGLGLAYAHMGLGADALRCFQEALDLNERESNPYQAVQNLINLSLGKRDDDSQQALALARRALELATRIGYRHYVPHCLCTLALAQLACGDAGAAARRAREAAELGRRSGDAYLESWALLSGAQALLALRRVAQARCDLRRGLELAWERDDVPLVLGHLAAASRLAAKEGDSHWSASLQAGVRAHPRLPRALLAEIVAPSERAPAGTGTLTALVQAALGWLGSRSPLLASS